MGTELLKTGQRRTRDDIITLVKNSTTVDRAIRRMSISHGDSSTKKRTGKCHVCGETGHFAECKDKKSDTEPKKVVHNEVIGLITLDEDPVLSKMRRRGWYLASRCTVHVCISRDMFVEYQPWTNHEVTLDFGSRAEVAVIGTVLLRSITGKVLTLSNVFHIPTIRKCLLSFGKLNAMGYEISFSDGVATITKNHELVAKGYMEDGLIRMSILKPETKPLKVIHKEEIGLILTPNEDQFLTSLRRRGWYLASRCSVHVCNSLSMFVEYQPWDGHMVILDNNDYVDVEGIGKVVLRFTTGKVLTLSNVFHMPTISKCLVSLGKLLGKGYEISVGGDGAVIRKNHEIVGKGYNEDELLRLTVMDNA